MMKIQTARMANPDVAGRKELGDHRGFADSLGETPSVFKAKLRHEPHRTTTQQAPLQPPQ
jgi:hypothetical protein